MAMKGVSNPRGSQFLRGVGLERLNGDCATGGPINVAANSDLVIGWTSGIPAGVTAPGSGFTIPAQGLYKAHAVVYVSGITPGVFTPQIPPQFGIQFTLNNNTVWASRRNVAAASGVKQPYVGLTRLETEAVFEANGGDTLRLLVRSNTAAGGFVMIGKDWHVGDGLNPYDAPAAFALVQRMPTTQLDSNTWLI